MLNERKLTQRELNDRLQYWWSKYCNSMMVDEKEIYLNLYNSYKALEEHWKKYGMIETEESARIHDEYLKQHYHG